MVGAIIVCAGLVLVVVIQSVLHYMERRELYDRLMSRNLNEFKGGGSTPQGAASAHKKVLGDWRKKSQDPS